MSMMTHANTKRLSTVGAALFGLCLLPATCFAQQAGGGGDISSAVMGVLQQVLSGQQGGADPGSADPSQSAGGYQGGGHYRPHYMQPGQRAFYERQRAMYARQHMMMGHPMARGPMRGPGTRPGGFRAPVAHAAALPHR